MSSRFRWITLLSIFVALVGCIEPAGPDSPSGELDSRDDLPDERVPGKYTFSLSASPIDPFVNTAPPSEGSYEIYLWLVCSNRGLTVLEIDLELTGDELPEAFFEPHGDDVLFITWEGSGQMDVLVGGCPTEAKLLGAIHLVGDGSGASVCFEKGTATAGAVDCDSDPALHGLAIYGFSSDGSAPCVRWPEDGCHEE